MKQELVECACGCGIVFPKYDNRGCIRHYYSPTHAINHYNKREIDESKLKELHGKFWTGEQLAQYFQVSPTTIKKRLKVLGLTEKREVWVGERNAAWRGGLPRMTKGGYIMLYMPNHPHAMKQRGEPRFVYEHILVWEETHGRPLPDGWVVHHINGKLDDNRPENLIAMQRGPHASYHNYKRALQKRIRELETEIKGLRASELLQR